MQHTEKKVLYDYGIHTWVLLLCLMASAVAVAEKYRRRRCFRSQQLTPDKVR